MKSGGSPLEKPGRLGLMPFEDWGRKLGPKTGGSMAVYEAARYREARTVDTFVVNTLEYC